MFEKLGDVESRYEEVNLRLQDPEIAQDQKRYRGLMKESADLLPLVTTYRRYKTVTQQISDNKAILLSESDEDLRQLAKEDLAQLENEYVSLQEKLKLLMLP